ncbi:chondroitinase-B domain-containing protein [Aquimarina algiphila]|nr:chondroitinase-B domain-containing protein [Aquimarina algiphila]
MKTFTYSKLLLFLCTCCYLSTYAQTTVSDDKELRDLVNSASAGSVFIIPNGTYRDFEARFSDAKGTPGNPIIIKAETIGGVTFTKESVFSLKRCEHIVLEGFVFDCEGENTLVKLEGSNNIRITRNVFELKTTVPIKWVFIGGIYNDYTFQHTSHHNRIDHNIFQNKTTPGHYITIDGTSNQDESDSRQSQYDRIDHNYFKNNSPRAKNEQESIRIGWSQMSKSSGFTIVEHNLFEDCDGDPEIVSVKSCDNIIRHNTFRKSYGTLSFRHGNRNRAEGNYFFGDNKPNGTFESSTIHTGGIRIYGTDHVIVNNYMEGLKGTIWNAPIALTQGDAIDGNSTNLTKHFRAERVTIAYNTLVNNTYGIEIGYDKPGRNPYNVKLKDITIANNIVTGSTNSMISYINGNDQGGEVKFFNNIMYPTGSANLTSDGSTFAANQVNEINPGLTFDGTVWRSTDSSPTISCAIEGLNIDEDIEGQPRPGTSNAGADHFSTASVRYKPLTPSDVGPNAGEDPNPPTNTLTVGTISDFAAVADSKTLSIMSNVNWSVSDNQNWISISPNNGSNNGTVEITVTKNTETTARTGVITVSGGSITRTINITQNGVAQQQDELTVSNSTISFGSSIDNSTFTINSNLNWTVSDNQNWLSTSPSSGSNNATVTVHVNANATTNTRTGIITITGGAITKTISVSQSGTNPGTGNDMLLNVSSVNASTFQSGNGPEKTLDKDLSTRWSAQGIGETITYDLGIVYDINTIKIAFFKGDQRTTTFDIAISEDGTNFATLISNQSSSGNSNDLEDFALSGQARYVRIIGKGNSSGNNWNSLTEVEIWGKEMSTGTVTESTLIPTIDTYIRGGSFDAVNYNTSTDLWVKEPNSDDYKRRALFKFDISALSGNITSAKLMLTPVQVGSTASDLTTHVYESDDFNSNVTYSQTPGISKLLDTKTGGYVVGEPSVYDITDLVNDGVLNSLNQISIHVRSNGGDASKTYVKFASKENSTISYQPKLMITATNAVNRSLGEVLTLNNNQEIMLYPLPVKDMLQVKGITKGYDKVIIFNLTGQIMYEYKVDNDKEVIPMSNLKQGIYIIKITGDNVSNITRKVVVKR